MMMNENKKKKKSGRLEWSIELHNKFVDAVNQLGIKKASPQKILQLMNDENLTYKHVASHLHKYKLHITRTSTFVPHQQQCSTLVQNINELPSSSSTKQLGQSNNTNDKDMFSTSTPSNEPFDYLYVDFDMLE
ncbi:hypothetical protein Lal_00012519, partial [Lupinus albus]